jgi:hypothetical protein
VAAAQTTTAFRLQATDVPDISLALTVHVVVFAA